jgi:hypothetical protein
MQTRRTFIGYVTALAVTVLIAQNYFQKVFKVYQPIGW